MKLSELKSLADIKSGQWQVLISDLTLATHFKAVVEYEVLPLFGRYIPIVTERQINFTGQIYTYAAEDAPDWITHVGLTNVLSPNFALHNIKAFRGDKESRETTKPTFIWKYENPKLFVEYGGKMVVKECRNPVLVADGGGDWDINNFDARFAPELAMLTAGHVMVAVGNDESHAKLAGLPIELNGEGLVSDGKELIELAKEEIREKGKWWLAVGG